MENDKKTTEELLEEQNSLLREQNQRQQEQRRFTILQRERAMSEAEKGKRNAAIGMGICLVTAMCAIHFNGLNPDEVIQNEINAIYSWPALVEYFKDLGPLTTIMAGGIGGFLGKYLRDSKRYTRLKNQFVDMNNQTLKKGELKSDLQKEEEEEKLRDTIMQEGGIKHAR